MELQRIERGNARRQGTRPYQEDQYTFTEDLWDSRGIALYSIFDGHGSDLYSQHSSEHMHNFILKSSYFAAGDCKSALYEGFIKENQALLNVMKSQGEGGRGGTTATVALIADRRRLFIANVGDSRSVLARNVGNGLRAIRVSRDHNLEDPSEKERIQELGAPTRGNRVYAPGHSLNMTRALGDFDFKAPFNQADEDTVSPVPSIHALELTPCDEFLILASDGLWDEYTDDEAVLEVYALRHQGYSAENIADVLSKRATKKPHADNTSVIVLFFKWSGQQTGAVTK